MISLVAMAALVQAVQGLGQSEQVVESSSKEEVGGADQDTRYASIAIIVVLLVMTVNNYLDGVLKGLKEKHPCVARYCQSTSLSTLLGILLGRSRSAGLLMKLFGAAKLSSTIKNAFEPLFMIMLLPPILFESALNMKKRPFFKNIGSIILFAFAGTLVAIFITAVLMWLVGAVGYGKVRLAEQDYSFYHCFIFGSLISATDPVSVLAAFKEMNAHSKLYSLIFGESIFNDAISLTLYRSLLEIKFKPSLTILDITLQFLFLVVFSGLLGLAFGMLSSLVAAADEDTQESQLLELEPQDPGALGDADHPLGLLPVRRDPLDIGHRQHHVLRHRDGALRGGEHHCRGERKHQRHLPRGFEQLRVAGLHLHRRRRLRLPAQPQVLAADQLHRLRHDHPQLLRHALRALLQHLRHLLRPVFLEVHPSHADLPVRHLVRWLPRCHGY